MIHVAITGAAGQIGYSLLFRLASGEVFGPHTQVKLHLLELPDSMKAAEGTAMELEDCAFPTLAGIECFDQAEAAFSGVNWALLVGSKPRGPGMERSDLIRANAPIFVRQGKALARAASDVRIVVVGNPCNTNALIAQHHCQEVPATRFSAMTMLDENRGKALLAKKIGVPVADVRNLVIWGNHSPTMYPDFENALVGGKPAETVCGNRPWLESQYLAQVQQRGAEIIQARGKSSAASAASACIDHIRRFSQPTPTGEVFSAAVPSNGEHYGIPKGLIFSFPIRTLANGTYEIVPNIPISAYAREKLQKTTDELLKEREIVKDQLL